MIKVILQEPAQLQHVLRTSEIYLVPRGEGRIVIGATLEEAGFDRQVEPAAVESLLARAAHLWPAAGRAQIVDSWAGLRPGTSDDLPLIGSADAANCWLATGHFRNGILLAPATGLIVRQLLEGTAPQIPLDAFAVERWAGC
jgi:glycine oxidase